LSGYLIWSVALLVYGLFYCWYIGFRSRLSPEEADAAIANFDGDATWTDQQRENIHKFFANDDGKDFVMVNLLLLNQPLEKSSKDLNKYQKIFLGQLLRKAGHPVLIARAASGNIENVACDDIDSWGAAGMVRYRIRRDLLEMLDDTIGSEHHDLKLSALERTFAFPASPWFIFGGPKLLAPLALALIAALAHLSI
jgi:hypothetical protein